MTQAEASLSYAVRPRVLRHYLSRLSLVLAALTLVPLGVAFGFDEWRLGGTLTAVVALLLLLWLSGLRVPPPRRLQVNEALVIAVLTFVLTPLLMVLPLRVEGLDLADALFESVSAITTTGLSTLAQVDDRSAGFLFLRAWMQWYGGLGIAVFSIALVIGHHSGARRLAETQTPENLPTTSTIYARQVLSAYVVLTLVAVTALWLALDDGFAAVVHALAGVSTGGFSSYDQSLAGMAPGLGPHLAIGSGILGALPLIIYYQVATRRPHDLSGDPEWWLLPLAVVVAAAAVALALRFESGFGWGAALEHGWLLGASAQTTTGFSSLEVGTLGATTKLLLILAMVVGGSVGSTAGGVKLLRLLIVAQLVRLMLRRTALPGHAVVQIHLGGHRLEPDEVQRALVILVLFALTVFVSWIGMAAGGYPTLDALFEVVSATATAGLSTGIVGHDLDPGLKLLLSIDMLLGRLEVLALLVVLYPTTWLGRRTKG